MERIRCFIDRLIMAILVLQGILLVIIICLAVFFRYVVGAALSWPEEIAGILFVWYTLLGVVALVSSDSHIAFDMIDKYLSSVIGKIVRFLSQCIVLLYGSFMAVYGWKYLKAFPFETSPAAGINLSWLKTAIPFTGVLVVFYVLVNMMGKNRKANTDTAKEKA